MICDKCGETLVETYYPFMGLKMCNECAQEHVADNLPDYWCDIYSLYEVSIEDD